MIYEKYFPCRWLAMVLASSACAMPAIAADAPASDTGSAPVSLLAADNPSLLSTPPVSGLRPVSPSDAGIASDASPAPAQPSASDAAPSLAAVSSDSVATPAPAADAASSAPATPSQNVTVNLINLMVKRGLITKDDAADLIKQAEQEADTARAEAAKTQATAEHALAAQAAAAPAPTPAPAAASDDEVRVSYVPDVVRQQITDQVKADVMKEARDENWTAKSDTPDWVKRFRVNGDIRVRYEGQFFPEGNDVGHFVNFNAINTGSGVDFNPANTLVAPQYDVDQDRNRFRLRARLGADIDLTQGFTAGLRIASGSDDSPVTENQTLGGANGQGGNFAKYQLWIDRAFIKYEMGGSPDQDLSFTIGRFDNPFFHTSMIWADDLGFDGAVVQGKYKVAEGVTPFVVAGGFPVFNTDLNFSTNNSAKFQSEDKYLLAGQLGTNWVINKDFSAKAAASYYYFENIEGKVSDPIPVASSINETGSTDDSRPAFAQNGNTYIALRDYTDPAPGTAPETQYFGLATPFHEFAFTSQIDYSGFDPFHVALIGEFVKNLAFDRNAIINGGPTEFRGPQNNTLNASPDSFVGGDTGWIVRLKMGKVALEQLWDWNVEVNYRYVESDATVDGFTDADFGGVLVGTNLKGFVVGGNVALSPRVSAGLRWMSAEAVAGPVYKNDLIQFDINAKF